MVAKHSIPVASSSPPYFCSCSLPVSLFAADQKLSQVPVLRMESLIGTYTFDHRDFRAVVRYTPHTVVDPIRRGMVTNAKIVGLAIARCLKSGFLLCRNCMVLDKPILRILSSIGLHQNRVHRGNLYTLSFLRVQVRCNLP